MPQGPSEAEETTVSTGGDRDALFSSSQLQWERGFMAVWVLGRLDLCLLHRHLPAHCPPHRCQSTHRLAPTPSETLALATILLPNRRHG